MAWSRRIALLLVGCWLIIATYGTLAGLGAQPGPRSYFNLVPFRSYFADPPRTVAEVLGNVALFVPLGLLLPFVSRRWTLPLVLSVAAVLSMIIEVGQFLLNQGRSADIDDVVLNVIGAVVGWSLWLVASKIGEPARPR